MAHQYRREVSQVNALRTINGKNKHLDMLLLDRLKENESTYGKKVTTGAAETMAPEDTMPMPLEEPRFSQVAHKLSEDPNDPVYWLPPNVHGGLGAREQSRMVNSRRTPSGNYFNLTNPSLHLERVPSTNNPPRAYQVEIDAMINTKRSTAISEEKAWRDNKNAEIDSLIAAKKGVKSDVPAWATAHQLGDRVEGKKVSKLISSKRTPIGGFFQPL
eukprot:CAMPEP_0197592590 /NCGR_PEP_ID=MMETSP1326-20131121/15180_1 /TAXON_ID=1155430 /ORGANISM="Genus nov. species nov., Strain RCC2288" /LENGTH=215 /DNA_ID=CAMNT_0043158307 /DNA_START=48 /DNA_END=695 /DNA_ORIENTATION=+